ncbi:MAG TPA: FAD:protein FMN transferase, partial [Blastocatellia bacterium]|nr:FAD:protein FMN transferase [Blastocatellia bacterium]
LFELLTWCRELSRETGGAFDITSGPLSRCWGFLRREGRVPGPAELERARALVGSGRLRLDPGAGTIRFEREGVELNFGSVGKGYALDRAAALIRGRVRSALLSAGSSSMRAIGGGARGDAGWVIGVRHPKSRDRRLAVVKMRDAALSTSGSEEQFFESDGRRYGHLLDPRSGLPADRVAGVTVIAESAALTDALATAFYIGGPELAESYCSTHPGTLVLMLENGSKHPVIFGGNDRCEVELIHE